MSEKIWTGVTNPRQPFSRPLRPPTQPLVLAARPANDIGIDPVEGRKQLLPIEVAVVVDPALDGRVVRQGQIFQGLVAAMMPLPAPDRPADGRQRFRAGGRPEGVNVETPVPN